MKVKFHTANYRTDNGSKIYYPFFGLLDGRLLYKATDDDFLKRKMVVIRKELISRFPSIEILDFEHENYIKIFNFFFKEDSDEFYFLLWSSGTVDV